MKIINTTNMFLMELHNTVFVPTWTSSLVQITWDNVSIGTATISNVYNDIWSHQ